jgi:hypothetical protein
MENLELAALAGALLSLLFEYVPGLSGWYDAKDEAVKRLIMLGAIVVVAAGIYGLSCFNTPWVYVECTTAGLFALLGQVVMAIVGNQSIHRLTKKAA